MKRHQFSDTVDLQLSYLAKPSLILEYRIIHAMFILTCTMTDVHNITFNSQLDEIIDLCNLF